MHYTHGENYISNWSVIFSPKIAKMAKITKNVSNKVARHTNAQLWVRYGAEGAILSKMMGHTAEKTTKNYYDVNLPEIVEGTKRADFKKLGI